MLTKVFCLLSCYLRCDQLWLVLALSLKMPVPLSESPRALSLWASAISCGFNKKQLICLEASKYTEELEPNCFYLFLLVHCALSLGVENLVDHLCSPFFFHASICPGKEKGLFDLAVILIDWENSQGIQAFLVHCPGLSPPLSLSPNKGDSSRECYMGTPFL